MDRRLFQVYSKELVDKRLAKEPGTNSLVVEMYVLPTLITSWIEWRRIYRVDLGANYWAVEAVFSWLWNEENLPHCKENPTYVFLSWE